MSTAIAYAASTFPPIPADALAIAERVDFLSHRLSKVMSEVEACVMAAEEIFNATGATGAAVGLKMDGEVVCFASTGDAPDVGSVVRLCVGVSGECLATCSMVRCDDTECDRRVNTEAALALHARSILCVPIVVNGSVLGIAEVLHLDPQAFGWQASSILGQASQALGRRIAELREALESAYDLTC